MKNSTRPADGVPLFLGIARSVTDDIRAGRLAPGTRLPSSRTLARQLRVHRNTVLAAYTELSQEGWIETSRARGTFVSRALPEPETRAVRAPAAHWPEQPGFSLPPAPTAFEPPVPEGTLVMSGGIPDLRLAPVTEIARAYRRALRRKGRTLLGYADARGEPRLRAALAGMLSESRGLPVGADDVLVTRGSQMALDLVARTLLRKGDVVAVEALGYPPAWRALSQTGARLVAVRVDADGIDVASVERLAEERGLRAVYLTPHHQYPSTVTLTAARRLALLELARRRRFAIIEDDYDHEFHYEWRPVLPLASADRAGVVVYIGTLSKILAPGLRLGYLVAPRRVLDHVVARRVVTDRQGDHGIEHAVAELIEDGDLARHARRMRRVYMARRDTLAGLLEKKLSGALELTVPPGGMALWASAAPGIDVDGWATRALERGVLVHTARRFAFDRRKRPQLRLGFAALDESELSRAVARLAAVL